MDESPRTKADFNSGNQPEPPRVAFKKHTLEAVAQIVVRAESQQQLDHVLMALSRAVSSYQVSPHQQGTRRSVKR